MAIIEATALSKTYQNAVKEAGLAGSLKHFIKPVFTEIKAVSEVRLSIEPGETVAYVGPNGAGN